MKNIFILKAFCLLSCCLSVLPLASLAKPVPAIVRQPKSQTVQYGSDVVFTVGVNNSDVKFQWQKDGVSLVDYGNVAGAQADSLELIGVGQKDAGTYWVIVSTDGGAVTSSIVSLNVESVVAFSDDFESGPLASWRALKDRQPMTRASGKNHTPGGSNSAAVSNAMQKVYHNLGMELRGKMKASFWVFDDADNNKGFSWYTELRGYTGKGEMSYTKKGGIQQIIALGRYDVAFGNNGRGSLAGEVVDPTKYQGRVWMGTNAGWFNLDAPGVTSRSPGWHKFEIERLPDNSTLIFSVDGVVGKTVTGVAPYSLDCIVIGSTGNNAQRGAAWFDDIKVEAFPQKFDWETKDSEGDGLFDWMKARETGGTGSTQAITVFETPGNGVTQKLGAWTEDGTAIYAGDRRGYVEYVLRAPSDDAYRIEIEGGERNHKTPVVELPLIVSIDNEVLGRFNLPYNAKTNGFVRCFTPYLRTGAHTLRIYWDNSQSYCSLFLKSIRLQSLQGPDLNNNGIKDWVENRLLAQSGIDVAPASSAVSPVCIEGRGQYLSMMKIGVGTNSTDSCLPRQGAGNRWFCNVPLALNGPTEITVSHQNEGLEENVSVTWLPTNLLEANDMTVRKGDAVLLTAFPPGTNPGGAVQITVDGQTNYTTDAASPVPYRFDRPGHFVVEGVSVASGASRAITVDVVDTVFQESVATWLNHARYVTFTNSSTNVVLEADPRLKSKRVPVATAYGKHAQQFSVANDSTEPRVFLARLGAKGPILDSTPVQGFRLFSTSVTLIRQMEVYRDGSQLIEAAFILSPVLSDVTIELQILVSGVTFDDGTLSKTFTAKDFDALGICHLRFIRAAGVTTSICHSIKAYQNGVLIGWPTNPK